MKSYFVVLIFSLILLLNEVDSMARRRNKGLKNRIPNKMKPKKDDIVPDPGSFIPEKLDQYVKLETTRCDLSMTLNLAGGNEYLLRNPGYPAFSGVSSRCQWSFLVAPGVDVTLVCSAFEVPCFYNAELYLRGSDGASGFLCTRSTGLGHVMEHLTIQVD